jgi:hypothetical protein
MATHYATLYQVIPPNSYRGQSIDMTFKKSSQKGDKVRLKTLNLTL